MFPKTHQVLIVNIHLDRSNGTGWRYTSCGEWCRVSQQGVERGCPRIRWATPLGGRGSGAPVAESSELHQLTGRRGQQACKGIRRGQQRNMRAYPVFQAPQESGAGQHREVLQAHPATAAQSGISPQRNETSPAATIPTSDPELASKPSVTVFDLPGAKPDQEEDAHAAAIDDPDVAGLRVAASPRRPTSLQQERGKVVQHAKLKGMSI